MIEKLKIKENKKLKHKMKLYKELEKIKFVGTNIIINSMSLNDLLDEINKVYNDKFRDYNDCPV